MSHCHNHHTYCSNTKIVRRNFLPWELGLHQTKITGRKPTIINNKPCFTCGKQLLDEGIEMCNASCQYTILINDWVSRGMPITAAWHQAISHLDKYSHDKDKIWQMINTKVEGAMSSKILEIKNNLPEPVNIILVPNPDTFFDIETNSENFCKHYQNLALIREEQEEWLCDLIYNPPIRMIYTIPEEEEPISSCILELESLFNPNSNFDNNDNENTGSSSVQIGDNNNNDSNSDSNSNPKYEQYIALPDFSKEQELK
ncbi:hypothetical protein G9A89_015159 [Geosiphon pyriformis]|nr:hypothetical protein G9A89_015159 [Geosiphon pyriformis]